MARYTEAVCRQCRREGQKLFLKGDKCYTDKCAMVSRAKAPGMHEQGRNKTSEYGLQLREKQKAKRYYGVLEKQFRGYYELAGAPAGPGWPEPAGHSGEPSGQRGLPPGFAMSRPKRASWSPTAHFTVNGRKMSIPSFLVKPGMVITLKETSRDLGKIKASVEANAFRQPPKWLEYDANNMIAKVVAVPEREDIDLPIEEHLIVELYSK